MTLKVNMTAEVDIAGYEEDISYGSFRTGC